MGLSRIGRWRTSGGTERAGRRAGADGTGRDRPRHDRRSRAGPPASTAPARSGTSASRNGRRLRPVSRAGRTSLDCRPRWTPRKLHRAVRAELRGLPKDLADVVAGHLVLAGELIDTDPELAYGHAEAARRRAARLPIVREATAETAYAAGHFDVALSEFRALRRMTGVADYLPVMADCERALGPAPGGDQAGQGGPARDAGSGPADRDGHRRGRRPRRSGPGGRGPAASWTRPSRPWRRAARNSGAPWPGWSTPTPMRCCANGKESEARQLVRLRGRTGRRRRNRCGVAPGRARRPRPSTSTSPTPTTTPRTPSRRGLGR